MRYAARRDGNASAILDALRKTGFTVMDFSLAGQGIPDALVTRALPDGTPWVCWVEVKMPKGRLKTAQEAFRDVFEPRGEHYVARDAEAAIRELHARYTAAIRPEQLR
jgi:hypothetical protein